MDYEKKALEKFEMNEDVLFILNEFKKANKRAWLVGGCVRDILMEKTPADWDICTEALPEETMALFEKTVPTGLPHGTITVYINKSAFEVTTLRVDGLYEDHRRPAQVIFTTDLEKDLARRDFTMNSIAMDENGNLFDPFNGIQAIWEGRIIAVGDPMVRFQEDSLRILRAVRFHCQLGFQLEESLLRAIRCSGNKLLNVAPERVQVELNKILCSDHPEWIFRLEEFGIMEVLLPEFIPTLNCYQNNSFHGQTVSKHIEKTLSAMTPALIKQCGFEKEPYLKIFRWAMLLHDVGKPYVYTVGPDGRTHFYRHEEKSAELTESILKRLRFSNEFIRHVRHLVRHHDLLIEATEKAVRRAMNRLGTDAFREFLVIKRADILGQKEDFQGDRLSRTDEIEGIYNRLLEAHACVSLKDLAIHGDTLLELGVQPGKALGQLLQELLEYVMENPERNTIEDLIAFVKEKKNIC